MLIVEGPDGAGKTTLIRQFQEAFDIPVAPRVVSKDAEAMTDLQDCVDNNLDEGFQSTIFDRHRLISETIYGPVLRSYQSKGFDDLSWLGPRLQRFYDLQPIIIYCLPPLEVVRKNIEGDEDNKVVAAHIDALYTAYVARASLDHAFSPGMVKIWDYTKSPKIKDRMMWFNTIHHQLRERTAA